MLHFFSYYVCQNGKITNELFFSSFQIFKPFWVFEAKFRWGWIFSSLSSHILTNIFHILIPTPLQCWKFSWVRFSWINISQLCKLCLISICNYMILSRKTSRVLAQTFYPRRITFSAESFSLCMYLQDALNKSWHGPQRVVKAKS